MEDRETPRMHKYGETKTTRIMMATVRHVAAWAGRTKYQAAWFLLNRVYCHSDHSQDNGKIFLNNDKHCSTIWSYTLFNAQRNEPNKHKYFLILLSDSAPGVTDKHSPIYIQQDATLHSLLYLETALHVSGVTSTHHQKRKQLYLQHLVFVTPLLLPAAIVEELRRQSHNSSKIAAGSSNCVKLHLVGYILDYICDAQTHERQIYR